MARFLKKENGQSMVEFALVLPMLLVIIFGIIDFGWLFYNQLSIQDACREGARYACVQGNTATIDNDVETKVTDNLPDGLSSTQITTSFDTTEGNVTVTIDTDIPILTGFLGAFFPGNKKHVEYHVTMKVEAETT